MMEIITSVRLEKEIYDIYAAAAKYLGNCKTEDVLSSALYAYARHIFQDMQDNGELKNRISQPKQ